MGISATWRACRRVIGHELLGAALRHGDRVAYVPAVYEAEIINGTPAPSDGELSEIAWFTAAELQTAPLSRFTQALLTATGHLAPRRRSAGGAETV